jgi:hypothetical protein
MFSIYFVESVMVETSIEDGSLFHYDIDGLTLRDVTELDQYREWLELCHAGS